MAELLAANQITIAKVLDGEKGEQGIPGIGQDGRTSYLHIAYATSADGSEGFSISESANKTYIGQYTDFVSTDSTDHTKYAWTKIKGEIGADGYSPTVTTGTSSDGSTTITVTNKDGSTTTELVDGTAREDATNAAKVATNFIGYDSTNGLIIGNKTSGTWSGYRSQILPGSFNVLDPSSTVLASFGPTTIIGEEAKANMHLTFNNLSMVDKDGTTLFEVGDNRNAEGIVTLQWSSPDVPIGTSGSTTIRVGNTISSIVSVYVDSVELSSSNYSFSGDEVTINNLTANSEKYIEIIYNTTDPAYYLTFGYRRSSSIIGEYSVAEGRHLIASGFASHAEGAGTSAIGAYSHAEGHMSEARGAYSHAGGYHTVADGSYMTAFGSYNTENSGKAFVVGIGDFLNRRDGFTVDWNGNATMKGGLTLGTALSIANGGTGAKSLAAAQENLGIKANSERIAAIATDLNVQKSRIDTFTSLPEGSTSGNAELADIRVGANGTTYDTAGNAVRGQIGELKSDLTSETNVRANADNALSARITNNDGDILALKTDTVNLGTHKVAQPLDGNNQPTNGTSGQSLRTKGDGTTEWASVGLPTDEQTANAVSAWLNKHPEATTSVLDGSLTEPKFSDVLKLKTIKDYVTPEMFGAVGDGVADDTVAIQNAIDASNNILFANTYKVASTLYLSGSKNLDIFGTIHYTGTGNLFYLYNHFNHIDGHNIGVLTGDAGDGTLICITTTARDNTEVYSYYNKVVNIIIRESARGVLLYNPETASASYFNTIEKCTFISCPIGIELKGFANGNRLNNTVFYNCGVANDLTHASIVFTEENDRYPEENNISQVFVTNSYDTVCFYVNGRLEFSIFDEIILEPGGNSKSLYSVDYSKIKHCKFQVIDITNNGFPHDLLGSGCVVDGANRGMVIKGRIKTDEVQNPLSTTLFYSNDTSYAENSWIPLLTPSILNARSMRVSIVVYVFTGIMFSKQYHDELNTIVYNASGGYGVTNSDLFKVEGGKLYFKSQPIEQGGNGLRFKIELTIGSYSPIGRGQEVDYTMDSAWTQI